MGDDKSSDLSSSDFSSNSDSSFLDSNSDSDRSRHISRSKKSHRRKRRRYYRDSSDSSETELSDESRDSDVLSKYRKRRHGRLSSSRSMLSSEVAVKVNGPIGDMLKRIDRLGEKFIAGMVEQEKRFCKIQSLNRKVYAELLELCKVSSELSGNVNRAGEQGQIVYPRGISQHRSGPAIHDQRAMEPIPPPRSLQPVSSNEAGDDSNTLDRSLTLGRLAQRYFPHPRAAGYKRVFEKSGYNLPIANQPTMAVLSIKSKTVHEQVFGGRRPRPFHLNPFSFQTKFEGIAATSSLDGSIQFWDINAQRMLLSVSSRENRVIPYAETLTWVSENTITVVSHLREGAPWPPAVEEPNMDIEPNSASMPETQTTLIIINFNKDGLLRHQLVTIASMPHTKPILAVAPVMRETQYMSYITGGVDKRLWHWKFHPPNHQSEGVYDPEGLGEVHNIHTGAITSVVYSHTSKILHSGGMDRQYIMYDMEHEKSISIQKFGQVLHIVQNPLDPRINAITLSQRTQQYILTDERTPGQIVLTFGYHCPNKISKLSFPSWHPDGGLFCTGTAQSGSINIWDVRWSGMTVEASQRPGAGIITGDVHFDGLDHGARRRHSIFQSRPLDPSFVRSTGDPSQIIEVGGKRVMHACFHPTKNVLMLQNADCSLTFA
ncbi:hypothetical protein BGZ51_005301 [Haplosporangium sp. Z 767]|nr:hypothetical protein BGZ51_005301 [Haplosporangium sp. Z 767]KAF9187630.1 hypothetical protein BGZ50_001823 [Haplosporangium sp. Z 11]